MTALSEFLFGNGRVAALVGWHIAVLIAFLIGWYLAHRHNHHYRSHRCLRFDCQNRVPSGPKDDPQE